MSDQRLSKAKEYLTVGDTLEDLRQQEPALRAAGFRKRRNAHGQAETLNREFFQWWDRKGSVSRQSRRVLHKCVRCGSPTARSQRGRSQWCKVHLSEYREYARNYYHEKLKPLRRKVVMQVNPYTEPTNAANPQQVT